MKSAQQNYSIHITINNIIQSMVWTIVWQALTRPIFPRITIFVFVCNCNEWTPIRLHVGNDMNRGLRSIEHETTPKYLIQCPISKAFRFYCYWLAFASICPTSSFMCEYKWNKRCHAVNWGTQFPDTDNCKHNTTMTIYLHLINVNEAREEERKTWFRMYQVINSISGWWFYLINARWCVYAYLQRTQCFISWMYLNKNGKNYKNACALCA